MALRRSRAGDLAAYALLACVCVWFIVPIFWIFSTSLKPTPEILVTPMTLLPKRVTFEHYRTALSSDFRAYLTNSLIAATVATLAGLALSIPAGFGFAKFPYRGSRSLLSFTIVSRVFPPIALALPFFLQFRLLRLTDNPWGLAIAYVPIALPLMIWVLHGFFRDFPDDLLDAARMDGLGVVQTLIRIVIPLSLPGLGVATLFGFLLAWNEFVIALTLTRTPAGETMPVGISTLITQFQVQWGEMMAVAGIYLLPVFAVTVIAQRGIVRGLMSGAVKS
ncbi:MAG: carbohydrate ABC transporter permease [Hyphomicrobiales bacterium]|nr:carbohydrate ABC transporter permease [Hyphomicrobiales bacterium]